MNDRESARETAWEAWTAGEREWSARKCFDAGFDAGFAAASPVVDDTAIERAAKEIHEGCTGLPWELDEAHSKEASRSIARAALTAALGGHGA